MSLVEKISNYKAINSTWSFITHIKLHGNDYCRCTKRYA